MSVHTPMRRDRPLAGIISRPILLTLIVTLTGAVVREGAAAGSIIDLGTLGGKRSHAWAINDNGLIAGEAMLADESTHAAAWIPGEGIVDLGTLGGFNSTSTATHVNAKGLILGESRTADRSHAFLWSATGGMVDLGTLGGRLSIGNALTDAGHVVGSSSLQGDIGSHAVLWPPGGGLVDLHTFGNDSSAKAVTSDGRMIVGWVSGFGPIHAFAWTAATGMVDIGTLGGNASADFVTDSGFVVGRYGDHTRGFSWTASSGMVDMGTLGGTWAVPMDMNATGAVVGFSYKTNSSDERAFLWTTEGGMVDLGTLGGSTSRATSINDNGVVVGTSLTAGNRTHAFLWTPAAGMIDLGEAGFVRDVNNRGAVVGSASHAVLWPVVAPAPTITSITPTLGPQTGGTPVTIAGTNFLAGAAVSIGGVAATGVTVQNATTITATTGARAAGAVDVVVTNPDWHSGTLTNGFTYVLPAPTVTTITPATGPVAGGTAVTITGTNFVSGATVSIGGVAATGVTVQNTTTITAITGAHAAGPVDVVVTNPDTQTGTKTNAFTDVAPPARTVVFQDDMERGSGNWSAQPTWAVTTESAHSGTRAWSDSPGGGNVNVGPQYLISPPIDLSAFESPQLKFWHRRQLAAAAVRAEVYAIVDGGYLQMKVFSDTDLGWVQATIDLSAISGASNVRVAFNMLRFESFSGDGWYIDDVVVEGIAPTPTVTSTTPSVGPSAGGTPITITGGNFLTGATVAIGGVAATGVTVQNATTITATTGAHAAGAVNVVVTNPDTQSSTLTNGFTYVLPPPGVTAIAPSSGPTAGGTPVTITGNNFVNGATVSIGGVAATGVTVSSATTITATTGAHAAGMVDIVVTNPDTQTGTKADAFTYVNPPTVTSILLAFGPTAGGQAVTITGTSFEAGAAVSIGGVSATGVTVVNATTIAATTGPHAAGVVGVLVTNPSTLSSTLVNAYTYALPPTVSSIAPAFGPSTGGTAVTIVGSGFRTGATIAIGGVVATSVTVVNATTITATTAAHAAGIVSVVVTNSDAQSGTLANSFSYSTGAAPSVVGTAPNSGSSTGGTLVTISGADFLVGATASNWWRPGDQCDAR